MSVRRSHRRQKDIKPEYLDEPEVYIDTTCNICDAEFVDYDDLQLHKEQLHPHETFTDIETLQPEEALQKPYIFTGYNCYFCNDNYSNIEWLSLHIRDEHIKDLCCCEYCLRVFTSDIKLNSHKQLHMSTQDGVFSCSHCPLFLKTITELQKHEYEEHNEHKRGVLLNDCFPHLASLLNMRVDEFLQAMPCSGRRSQLFVCVCDYKSSVPTAYLDHLKRKGCSSPVCDKCHRPYKNMRSLKRHIKKKCCSIRATKKYCDSCKKHVPMLGFALHRRSCLSALSCKFCSKTFKNIEAWTAHQKEHAKVITKKKCYYCRLELYNLRVYKNHVEKCHGKNFQMYKYPCVYCNGYIFCHPQKLFAHFYSCHKDISPYKCNICGAKFRIRKQFTLHIKMVHKGIGFVEFTDQLHVHFNKEKSGNAFVPAGQDNLFDSADEEEFRASGLYNEKPKKIQRRPRKKKAEDSDDEPLIKKRKLMPLNKLTKLLKNKKKSPRLTCKICNKYCYTVQNYNRHVSLHFKENNINCVKCDATFKTKKALDKHLGAVHETTLITAKLKTLLEKKRLVEKSQYEDFTQQPNLTKLNIKDTIKRVEMNFSGITATVKEVRETSAKNFLETFVPEVEKAEKKIGIDVSVSIKPIAVSKQKQFSIKMVKCNLAPLPVTKKLRMPERVDRSNDLIRAKIRIRRVDEPMPKPKLNFGVREDMNIPEVAQEVIYQAKEEKEEKLEANEIKDFAEIVIPDHYNPSQIKVATLHSEAPYYRIVPLANLTKATTKVEEYSSVDEIKLPTGTLVRSNPLAHLMKGKNIKFDNSYEPKLKNPQKALANAILKLNKKEEQNAKMRKDKKSKNSKRGYKKVMVDLSEEQDDEKSND